MHKSSLADELGNWITTFKTNIKVALQTVNMQEEHTEQTEEVLQP
jgi:hypothetical protein